MSDEAGSGVLRREIEEQIRQAKEAQSLHQQVPPSVDVSVDIEKHLRQTAIDLFNSLKMWREDPEVNDVWEQYNLNAFGNCLREQTEMVVNENKGLAKPPETATVLKVHTLERTQLSAAISGLIMVAKELGFAPETTDKTPLEKGTVEDVKWLVRTRDQSKAIDELEPPENDPEALPDGGVAASQPQAADGPSIDNRAGRYPFRGPFFQLINDRKQQGKDAKIAVASANAETGVGKSTCAYYLAHVLDTSASGYYIGDKATLGVDEFLNAYDRLDKGSALILDEAEQLTGRRAMAEQNVKAGERWQMRRVQEICSLLTLPKFSVLDPLMKDLVDFRIEIQKRGEAVIYKKSHRPFGDTWWQAIQRFQYPDMDATAGMQHLHDLKDDFIDEEDEGMLSESEAKEEREKSVKDARRDERDRMIIRLYDAGQTQKQISNALVEEYGEGSDLAVSRRQVGNILEGKGEK